MSANIARIQNLPAAPNGLYIKQEILMPQIAYLLDQMFDNHVTYPNALLQITIDANWTALQMQRKSLILESETKGALNEEQQAQVASGEAVIDGDSSRLQAEINLNPKVQRQAQQEQAQGHTQPILDAPPLRPPSPKSGLIAEGNIVNARRDVGKLDRKAQKEVDSHVAQDVVGQIQPPQKG